MWQMETGTWKNDLSRMGGWVACSCVSGCSWVGEWHAHVWVAAHAWMTNLHQALCTCPQALFPIFGRGLGTRLHLPSILVSMWLDFAGFLQCRTEEEEEVMVGVNYIVVQWFHQLCSCAWIIRVLHLKIPVCITTPPYEWAHSGMNTSW